MGQRANYILIEEGGFRIHYSHWRANSIVADLMKGEKIFMEFVESCTQIDQITEDPWIEGCVVIDPGSKRLGFWSFEIPPYRTVQQALLNSIGKCWKGWSLSVYHSEMFDVADTLGIDWKREVMDGSARLSEEQIAEDGGYSSSLVMVRSVDSFGFLKLRSSEIEEVMSFGVELVSFVREHGSQGYLNESDVDESICLLIDEPSQAVYVTGRSVALYEEKWPRYQIKDGFGTYLGLLEAVGVNVQDLEMSTEEVAEIVEVLSSSESDFDPEELADKLQKDYGDVTFNPLFFDKAKPRPGFLDRLKNLLKRFVS